MSTIAEWPADLDRGILPFMIRRSGVLAAVSALVLVGVAVVVGIAAA